MRSHEDWNGIRMSAIYHSGPNGLLAFIVVTLILGGLAAFVSGRAIAETWRPRWQAALYMLPLAAGVRFVHFAVFNEPLLSLRSYFVDLIILLVMSTAGYVTMRRHQMERQYGWRSNRH